MKTRDILNTVTRILPDWHVYNDHQSGRITAFDPQAGYEITVNRPDSDTIRIVRTRYELVEDNTVLDTADMGEERALDELARLLAAPMPRTDRLMRLKDKFDRTAEWCRDTLGDEQEAKDVEDKANRLKALLGPDDPPLLDGRDIAILKELKPYGVVKPAEESQRLRELGVLERRYYIDQVFDALTDKGEKALEFASHVERTKRRRT